MADDSLDGLEESGGSVGAVTKKGKLGGLIPKILKWVAIGLGAIILIVTVVLVTNAISGGASAAPDAGPMISDNYLQKREKLDWYKSLGAVKTRTSDEEPASVVVDIHFGYKKDDKACSAEITQRTTELRDFLRNYFALKTIEELQPQNEPKIKIEIRNAINDNILSDSKIKDISLQQLDVIRL